MRRSAAPIPGHPVAMERLYTFTAHVRSPALWGGLLMGTGLAALALVGGGTEYLVLGTGLLGLMLLVQALRNPVSRIEITRDAIVVRQGARRMRLPLAEILLIQRDHEDDGAPRLVVHLRGGHAMRLPLARQPDAAALEAALRRTPIPFAQG